MYLSKIFNVIGDDYAIHQIVMSLFEGQRPLFQNNGGCITVLSSQLPKASKLTIETSTVEIPEQEGTTHLFSARFNPVKRSKKNGKREGLTGNEIKKWIIRKTAENGFTILDMKINDEGHRISKKGNTIISIRSIMVIGILTITDTIKFEKAMQNGIGAAKGLGFGLVNLF
jgi:CRISPR-associated protein Cas6/Cse3/CasE subtype I-E